MPSQANGVNLPPETAAMMLRDEAFRAEVLALRSHFIDRARYASEFGMEMPPDIRGVIPVLLRSLEDQERSERDREAAEQYGALREFVQAFRHVRDDTVDDDPPAAPPATVGT